MTFESTTQKALIPKISHLYQYFEQFRYFLLLIFRTIIDSTVYAMLQRARVDNLTVSYREKQRDVNFSCILQLISS